MTPWCRVQEHWLLSCWERGAELATSEGVGDMEAGTRGTGRDRAGEEGSRRWEQLVHVF